MSVAHRDDVEFHRCAKGEMDAAWQSIARMGWNTQKIFWRGVGVIGRIEAFDYFDGEPVEGD